MENNCMNQTNLTDDRQWLRYIETLRRQSQPVKIDILLQKRMQSFLEARQSKLCPAEE
ncbi:MAG: hypothetical protein JWM07_603 [Candidatus Saccharibacteria bacterium]|nr:hypothetical protein [Candidatus Saccharibacteria bacterium]